MLNVYKNLNHFSKSSPNVNQHDVYARGLIELRKVNKSDLITLDEGVKRSVAFYRDYIKN